MKKETSEIVKRILKDREAGKITKEQADKLLAKLSLTTGGAKAGDLSQTKK